MSPVSKFAITILVLTLSAVLLSSDKGRAQPQDIELQAPHTPSFQKSERTIKKNTDFNPPVKIKAVKTKGRSVPLDEAFIDEDDWLNGFAVLVRNDSLKSVTHIGVKLLFRPIGRGIPAAWILYYGPDPFLDKNGTADVKSAIPTIFPGGELELKFSDAELEDLKGFLKKVGFPDNVHTVELRINSIGFADGTAWYGKMLKRGTGSSKWTRIDTPSGPRNHHPQAKRIQQGRSDVFFSTSNNLDGGD